jgi:hypothetical protein
MRGFNLHYPEILPVCPHSDLLKPQFYSSLMINEELGPPGLAVTV